jgi:hypothetical protein
MRIVARIAVALAMAGAVAIGFAGSASAGYPGTIDVHVRACPSDAVEVFTDCHDNPVAGFELLGYNLDDCTTGDDGNCSYVNDDFDDVQVYTNSTDVFAVYCSADNEDVEIDIEDALVTIWWVEDVPTAVVCDFYVMDATLPPAHGDGSGDAAGAPNTGAGTGTDANLALMLAGAVALGGLAATSRRNAFR